METPFFPLWALRVAKVNHAVGLHLLTVKRVEASDLPRQHDHFRFSDDDVKAFLISYLTAEEREKATLHCCEGESSSSSAGRNMNGGLNVSVYVQGGWRVELQLTCCERSGETLLKGNEFELLRKFSNLEEGDNMAIWMFRHPDDDDGTREKFCFVLVKVNQ